MPKDEELKKTMCPECGLEISVEAEECPKCQAPIAAARAFNRVRKLADKIQEAELPAKPKKSDPLSGLFGKKG